MHAQHHLHIRIVRKRTADDGHRSAFTAHQHTRVGQHRVCRLLRLDHVFERFCLVERQSDACCFGEREHHLWHGVVNHGFWIGSGDFLSDGDALFKGAVGQRMTWSDVSQRPHAIKVRPSVSVDGHVSSFVELQAAGAEPVGVGIGHTSDGGKHHFAVSGAVLIGIALPIVHSGP